MTNLVTYLVTAMATWVPVRDHAWREPRFLTEARYEAIASDVADVVQEPDAELLDNDPAWTAVVLLAIASYESAFRGDVDVCRVTGPRSARSLWQIEGRPSVCRDRKHAARTALAMVRESLDACRRLPEVERLSFYTSGHCQTNPQARWRWRRAVRWQRAMPFVGGETSG